MEKRVLLILSAIFVLFFAMVLLSANEDDCNNKCKVKKAEECLRNKTRSCSGLSQSEMVFSALSSVGSCRNEAIRNFKQEGSEKCWPESECTIKETSQTLLLLDRAGETEDKDKGKNWTLGKKKIYGGIDWHLQIDSNEATQCTIKYNDGSIVKTDVINISANRRINEITGNGNCFTKSREYWLDISDTCYGKEFNVTCDKSFSTNNFYIKDDVYYINSEVQGKSANHVSVEKLNSFCLGTGNGCDYEGTLWGAYVLSVLEEDASAREEINKQFLPYLTTEAENNGNLLPEAIMSGTYDSSRNGNRWENELKNKQHSDGYWSIKGNNFYGTAIAYGGLTNEAVKAKAIRWILNNQDTGEEKCWDRGNVKNTGLILYNVFGGISPEDLDEPDTQPPSVTIHYPSNSRSYNIAPNDVKYQASDNDRLKNCWYQTAKTGTHSSDTDCSGAKGQNNGFPYVPSVEGTNTWTVHVEDRSGNKKSDSVSFTVNTNAGTDTQKPRVNITFPKSTTYGSHKNELLYQVNDNVGAIACWYSKDNGRNNSTFQNCSSREMNPRSAGGQNTWTVYAMDRKGNIGSHTIRFTINADDNTDNPGGNTDNPTENEEDDDSTSTQCEKQGYKCLGTNSCSLSNGKVLEQYTCSGTRKCCSLPACRSTSVKGIICRSSEECEGGIQKSYVSGLSTGQKCCTGTGVKCKQASGQNEESDDNAENTGSDDNKKEKTECENANGKCSLLRMWIK